MFRGTSFRKLHHYVFDSLLLASALIVSVAIIAWDVHGLILLIRWMWVR